MWTVSIVRAILIRYSANVSTALQSLTAVQTTAFFAIYLLLLASFVPLQQNADGILLTIMSIQKLTIFYWGQDRYGAVAPLMTAWIRSPFYNVYAQLFIRLMAGLLAPVFYCSLAFRRPANIWRATLLADGLLLIAGSPAMIVTTYVDGNPYSTSLAFAGLATTALRASPRSGGVVFQLIGTIGVVIAYIVDVGLIAIGLPLVALFTMLLPSVASVRLLVIHLLAAAIGFLLPGITTAALHTPMGLEPSIHSITHYAMVIWDAGRWVLILTMLLSVAVLLLYFLHSARSRALRLFLTFFAVMVSVAVLYFLVVAWSRWVGMNGFPARYFAPGFLLLASVAGISLWAVTVSLMRGRIMPAASFTGLMTVLIAMAYLHLGARGPQERDIIGNGRSGIAREVAARYVALSLDGIVGDFGSYWDVWPAVLIAEQYEYDNEHRGPNVLGITYRGGVRREQFLARLAARGRLQLACVDLAPADCASTTSSEMQVAGLRFSEPRPMERLSGHHKLWFVEIALPEGPE